MKESVGLRDKFNNFKYVSMHNISDKMSDSWHSIIKNLIAAVIIVLLLAPIITFVCLRISEKQTTIVAIEYSVKVAMCTWSLLGCLGAIVSIVINTALKNLEEIRKTDEYLARIEDSYLKSLTDDDKEKKQNCLITSVLQCLNYYIASLHFLI